MVLKIPLENIEKLREYLKSRGFNFEERAYQFFFAKKPGVVVNVYSSGKVVFGGNKKEEIEEIVEFVKRIGGKEEKKMEDSDLLFYGTRIGTDEVGKGDYFGPLVVAGVLINEEIEKMLQSMKVKDSKLLSDTTIRNLAHEIRNILKKNRYEIVSIPPIKYNQLHRKFGNVNRILGWAHARVIENLLSNGIECNLAIADQFGDQGYIKNALMERGKQIKLIQTPRAERDIAVAAASILARDKFLWKMEDLREAYRFDFPRGAGKEVDERGREFIKLYSPKELMNVSKIHFSNTMRILGKELKIEKIEEVEEGGEIHLTPIYSNEIEDIRLECFNLLSSFESELREFIELKLKEHYAEKWWENGIPEEIRLKAERNVRKELEKGRKRSPIEGLQFANYETILCNSNNWRIFSPIFGDKNVLVGSLRLITEIRNLVAHSRELSAECRVQLIGAISYLRNKIRGQKTLDSFGIKN